MDPKQTATLDGEDMAMIERTVLVKLKESHAGEAERREVASHSREALSSIPGVTGVTVAVAADEKSSGSWDLVMTVRFAALEDVPTYAAHPLHRAYVDDYLRPRMETIRAWNFETV
jgi:hypothetical protein